MKKPEEYLREAGLVRKDAKITDNFALNLTRDCHVGSVKELLIMIKQVQIDTINETVKKCAENVELIENARTNRTIIKEKFNAEYDFYINESSILNVANELIKEIQ